MFLLGRSFGYRFCRNSFRRRPQQGLNAWRRGDALASCGIAMEVKLNPFSCAAARIKESTHPTATVIVTWGLQPVSGDIFMTRIIPVALAITLAAGAMSLVAQSASALPVAPMGSQAQQTGDIELVQFGGNNNNNRGNRNGGAAPNRGGGGGPVRRGVGGGGGRGGRNAAIGVGAAVIGLGLLGAAAAANSAPARECWTERQPVVNRYGEQVGVRRVRVCN
jgi:hypothetical protein